MRKVFLILSAFTVIVSLFSCRVSRMNISTGGTPASAYDYIERWKDVAINEMRRTGVPASITLAQGMIESGYGRSRLAVEANNHFGIKCHNGWTGPTIKHHDDRRNECFRKYRNAEESFRDHSDFLRTTPRYSFLFSLEPTDYKAWAKGLKKAGYATNPDYDNMLIRKIEEYGLYEYDRVALAGNPGNGAKNISNGKIAENNVSSITDKYSRSYRQGASVAPPESSAGRIMENNRIKYVVVREGDTRESLEKELKLLRWELSKYNELPEDFTPEPGQILYIQPKRKKAEPGKEIHTVGEGETMYSVSQKYGIKLRYLYYYNRMEEGSEPEPGRKLWLRRLMPVD